MKGFTNITLMDKDNNVIEEYHDKNFITNLIKNRIEYESKVMLSPPSPNSQKMVDMFFNGKNYFSSIGGLLLFGETLPDNVNYTHHNRRSLASAGTANDLSNPLKGTLNAGESGSIKVDGKNGYRFVWDFGTANANCTFNAIALTTHYAGDRITNKSNSYMLGGGGTVGIAPVNYPWVMNSKGTHIYIKDNKIHRYVGNPKIALNQNFSTINIIESKDVGGFIELSTTIFLDDKKIIIAGKKDVDSKWYMLSLNEDTLLVEKEYSLGEANLSTGFLKAFSRLNTEDLAYNWELLSNGTAKFSVVNIKTGAIDPVRYSAASEVSASMQTGGNDLNSIATHKSGDFYYTSIKGANHYASSNLYGVFIYDKDRYVTTTSSGGSYDHRDNRVCQTIGYDVSCMFSVCTYSYKYSYSYNTHYAKTGCYEYAGVEPLFTINNLDNPVTKTEANTMKITYTLIWD